MAALGPLLTAIGGELVDPTEAGEDDVPLHWDGATVAAVRLPLLSDSLDHLLDDLRRRHGRPLAELDRRTKQRIVRSLEQRGAFALRHGVETVAAALGVSRFTVYNYLNYVSERRAEARGDEGGSRRDG
ncbi:helix-turn-helix domain-containing protein [Streptomyces sp. DSM 44915]|uniref:Helix-turn-helix domain-containing protein n=1 Tax=Streptomyces chisholmiae TaxID=3075540 RepID=A0ABU2JMX6_9ACTN|nr:helix-turn-helix domain-containing protein [Streptomyces sp. DSM 44915]MDT0266342.1 helix-turn-helix domain-containing protein [Streptomyces sp. DSM 44915]